MELNLRFSSTECCGSNMEVRAFIENADSEGAFPVFMHNRFRRFDGQIVQNELTSRRTNLSLINQSGTSLCGMACIFYLFAKEQYEQYKWFTKLLFRTGEVTFNNYTVKPTEDLLAKTPNDKNFPKYWDNNLKIYTIMPIVDFVTLAGTRNADNNSYKGGDEEFQAINWPLLMTNLSQNLLGYPDVSSRGIYNPIKKLNNFPLSVAWKMFEDINQQILEGYKIILLIDSDLIAPDPDTLWNLFALEYH